MKSVNQQQRLKASALITFSSLISLCLSSLCFSLLASAKTDAIPSAKPLKEDQAKRRAAHPSSSPIAYGDEVSHRELKKRGWVIHPKPEGKRVGAIHVINLPVFLADERFSSITTPLNYLHVTTQESLIRRESRVKLQAPWSLGDALETERNLRGLGVFTSARVYPVYPHDTDPSSTSEGRPPNAERLDVVIITRDLWSLRLENSFSYNGGVLNQLNLSLSERNFLGRRILLSGVSAFNPFTMTYGLTTSHRRFGPDLSASVGVSGTWNRATSKREGERLEFGISRPLYNLDQAWSFGLSGGLGSARARITQGDQVVTDDDPSTEAVEAIPIEWDLAVWSVGASAIRQWRGEYQKSISFGVSASDSVRTIDSQVSETLRERWRSNYLPPDRFQVGPSVSFSWYRREYIALTDISTYGTREDLRIGPTFSTSHQLSLIGDQAYIPSASLGYTHRVLQRGFFSVSVSASARIEDPERIVNRSLGLGARWAIPLRSHSAHLGYLVGRGSLSDRWNDVSNVMASLGGDLGLRGYPNGAFTATGGGSTKGNFEYRSPPLKWSFVHLGAVTFYDGGSVHQTLSDFKWRQSAGGGVRFLFPQLNRSVFRLDLAAPLSDYPVGLSRPGVVLSFGSAQGFILMPWEG